MESEGRRPTAWLRWAIGKLLPPATPQPEERESIWSIRRKDATTFFRLLSVLWIAGMAYVSHRARHNPATEWNALAAEPGGPWPHYVGDFAMAELNDFSGVAIGIAIISMLLTRPVNITGDILMSLYQAMVNRLVIPVIERHKAEGHAEGLAAGRATERADWQAWNQRRMDAEVQGHQFDELPPGS